MKKYYPSWQTNPSLLGKEKTEDLCRKSYWIFKSKWRWRKLIEITGSNIVTLEKQFDSIIEEHDRKLQLKRKQMEEQNASKVLQSNAGDSNESSSEANDGKEV